MGASTILKLQKVGFSAEQVEALADFMDTQVASKADLEAATHRLEMQIADVRSDVKTEVASVRSEIKILEQRIVQSEQRMTIKLGGMLVVLAGIMIAAFRYLLMAH